MKLVFGSVFVVWEDSLLRFSCKETYGQEGLFRSLEEEIRRDKHFIFTAKSTKAGIFANKGLAQVKNLEQLQFHKN